MAVALGVRHGLALTGQSTVVAWGSNSEGELDVPEGIGNVSAIAAGRFHSLALVGPIPPLELRCFAPSLAGTRFSVSVPTVERHRYALEFKDSVSGTNWTSLSGIRGYGYGVTRRLTDSAAISAHRFYRVASTE